MPAVIFFACSRSKSGIFDLILNKNPHFWMDTNLISHRRMKMSNTFKKKFRYSLTEEEVDHYFLK